MSPMSSITDKDFVGQPTKVLYVIEDNIIRTGQHSQLCPFTNDPKLISSIKISKDKGNLHIEALSVVMACISPKSFTVESSSLDFNVLLAHTI